MTSQTAAWLIVMMVAGCLVDLLQIRAHPLAHGLYWPLLFGGVGTTMFLARIKRPRLYLPLLLLMLVGLVVGIIQVRATPTLPITDAAFGRIPFDTLAGWVGMGVGYRVLLWFISTEGLGQVRMQTELLLAHETQETLVPTLSIAGARFEIYGRSLPSREMGGDLIEVIPTDDSGLLVYIADISGHGLPAGQLMGMLKAAMRMALRFRHSPAELLESADHVLRP